MSSRKNIPSPHEEGNYVPASNFIRGQSSRESLLPERLEDRIAVHAMDIEQLTEDNHRLSATRIALSQDFVAAQTEIKNLTDHMRSIKTETDIQIRLLMDKIAKMEAEIIANDDVRKEYEQAHNEARSLALARKELINQIQEASEKLAKTHSDIKKLPEMRAEIDGLKEEHERLRTTFEAEKEKNVEKVGKMQTMEKEMVDMAEEVVRLRAEVHKAEQRAKAPPKPYTAPYGHPNTMYPPPVHGGGMYVDAYGWPGAGFMPQVPMPYGGLVPANAPVAAVSGTMPGAITGAGGNASWIGTYNVSHGPS